MSTSPHSIVVCDDFKVTQRKPRTWTSIYKPKLLKFFDYNYISVAAVSAQFIAAFIPGV